MDDISVADTSLGRGGCKMVLCNTTARNLTAAGRIALDGVPAVFLYLDDDSDMFKWLVASTVYQPFSSTSTMIPICSNGL